MPDQRKITTVVSKLLGWYSNNARDLPWRRTRDPYAIWVSEIMLQQTQVKTVLPYWKRWMQALPNIRSLAKATPQQIHKLWEGLGYYTRVRNMQRAAQIIVSEHGGEFPRDFDTILALPGIGRYTAGAICSIAFNQPTPILDGNVIRVMTRFFGIRGDPREKITNAKLWQIAEDLVRSAGTLAPPVHVELDCDCSHLNQSLMELGALICTPKNPRCAECPIKAICIAHRKHIVHLLPKIPRRAPTTSRNFLAFVIKRNSRYLVRQRPADLVNAHLWEFPNVEANGEADLATIAKTVLGFRPESVAPARIIKHTITRYRITMKVFQGIANGNSSFTKNDFHWLTPGQLRLLPFASAHKKILDAL